MPSVMPIQLKRKIDNKRSGKQEDKMNDVITKFIKAISSSSSSKIYSNEANASRSQSPPVVHALSQIVPTPATANIKSTSLANNRSPVQRLTTMNSELTEGEKQHLQVM
jgi:hypothetical protein